MVEKAIPADVARMSFEEALAELEGIVRQLEAGTGKLDDAIKAYERGADLKRHCELKLQEAQARVEKVVLGPDGPAGTDPMDID
ncbi:MAG: exodeoxyribonuclease VII small subunit [Rhodospirillales bacterium]|jgi:exodeoxyribonuclease VII small subunit|nr:exodeoxyribonuclease VII small subunit [Rhodospirillales bacterium]